MEENVEKKPESLDEKIHDYMKSFLETNNISEAIVIIKDPNTQNLALSYHGHFYDVARMVATINRKFKQQIEKELQ